MHLKMSFGKWRPFCLSLNFWHVYEDHLATAPSNLCIPNMKMIPYTKPILGLHPANERRRYFVTTSLIGWGQT